MADAKALRKYRKALARANRSAAWACRTSGRAWRAVRDLESAAEELVTSLDTEALKMHVRSSAAAVVAGASEVSNKSGKLSWQIGELAALAGVDRG